MISQNDRQILTEVGREYLLDIAMESKTIKEKISFIEHVKLCSQIKELTYEEVIALTITEDIRDFEGKFGKFLKYSMAAIAGMVFGGVTGPPITMFILYLYRKATDTCVRSCFNKLPLTSARKICKYQCQVDAAKRITREIRSEVSKCSQFEKAERCEKKLQGQYIKWAKRTQQLIVKLQQAKATHSEKLRKQSQRRREELERKGQIISEQLDLSKKQILTFVKENKQLRDNISFKKHLQLYNICQYIPEEEGVPSVVLDPKKEKLLRQVLYLGLWVLPVPFFNDVVNYMMKKYSVNCAGSCIKSKKYSSSLCYKQCAYLTAKYSVGMLKKQLQTCNKAKKPTKCRNKIFKMMEDWKQREVERKIKFKSALKSETQKK
jgi:hypothetical protein